MVLLNFFSQEWEGDVTIVMPATLAQFAKIIQNPSQVELQKAINQGRRCAWEKLSAIKANCGIELVLDECVSFLNHMRRVKRNAERATSQGMGNALRFNGSKRIPSWNCMERESSWGSLDEDALTEHAARPGGPWGGPSGRSLKFSRNNHEGSDSESENPDIVPSWTRIGGPLMRTASATKFIQSFDIDAEFNKQSTRDEGQSHESPEINEAQISSSVNRVSSRDVLCNTCTSQHKRNWDRHSDPPGGHSSNVNDSDGDERYCSCSETRSWGARISGSTSRIAVAEGDLLQPERCPTGIVFNVVKREDIALVNRDSDVEYYQDGPDFSVDEYSHPDCPSNDIDGDDITAVSECGNINRDLNISEVDACSRSAKNHHNDCSCVTENMDSGSMILTEETYSACSLAAADREKVKDLVPVNKNEMADLITTDGSDEI